MKMLKLVVLALVIVIVSAAPRPESKYKGHLDHVNLKDILNNNRLVDNYINCALEKGRCTPEGREIKEQVLDLLPEILETNCGKCTDVQIERSKEILKHMRDKKRQYFDEILEKYDPGKELRTKYKEKYADLVEEEGYSFIYD